MVYLFHFATALLVTILPGKQVILVDVFARWRLSSKVAVFVLRVKSLLFLGAHQHLVTLAFEIDDLRLKHVTLKYLTTCLFFNAFL